MSITIEINKKQLHQEQPLQLHYIPAKIDGDGPANVAEFFENYTTEENGHLENALRGYPLIGAQVDVPVNYKALVLQETQKPLDENADRKLRITGTFEKFTYWNYDKIPSQADAYKQALQLLPAAEELAKPVTEEELKEEIDAISKRNESKENAT